MGTLGYLHRGARQLGTLGIFLALISLLILPAVHSTQAAAPAIKMGGTLIIDNESGSLWPNSYNPFSGAVNWTSNGIIYEPLIYVNSLNGKAQPWLATSYAWGNGNKTLTFTIRHGVQWSDGKPFSADDVVFTFDLMKKFPGLDLQSVWSVLKNVQKVGSDRVVMTFSQPAVPFFFYIADQDTIVAQHIWSSIKNPVTYADTHPIGTGPFMLQSTSPQTITYVRNPHYWQPGKPYIDKVLYPAFTSNPPANLYLAEGKAQWGGQFIPNIGAYYISRDRTNHHYWFPPNGNIDLFPNLTVYPLNNKTVRQALAYAINRTRASVIGEYGYEPPANQTGVLLPIFSSWYNSSAANSYKYTYNPQKSMALLKSAGFKMGSDGIFVDSKGKRLSLSVITVGGNTDWVAVLQGMQADMKAAGIDLQIQTLSGTDFTSRMQMGKFQLGYDAATIGPNPYYDYHGTLYSGSSAPIGQAAASNYERWIDPATDKLLNQYAASSDTMQQHAITNKLEQIMLENVPVIPVTEGVDWYQYDTSQYSGWPTQQNQYAAPAPYNIPDWEVVLLNLHLK